MYCLSRDKCLIVYSADYYVSNEKKYIYPSKLQPKILQTSSRTAFEIFLLQTFDLLLFRNGISFEGFGDFYNTLYPNDKIERNFDRRRLSESYFSFKIRNFISAGNRIYLWFDFKQTEISTQYKFIRRLR